MIRVYKKIQTGCACHSCTWQNPGRYAKFTWASPAQSATARPAGKFTSLKPCFLRVNGLCSRTARMSVTSKSCSIGLPLLVGTPLGGSYAWLKSCSPPFGRSRYGSGACRTVWLTTSAPIFRTPEKGVTNGRCDVYIQHEPASNAKYRSRCNRKPSTCRRRHVQAHPREHVTPLLSSLIWKNRLYHAMLYLPNWLLTTSRFLRFPVFCHDYIRVRVWVMHSKGPPLVSNVPNFGKKRCICQANSPGWFNVPSQFTFKIANLVLKL